MTHPFDYRMVIASNKVFFLNPFLGLLKITFELATVRTDG
jgi:hypothetical protein